MDSDKILVITISVSLSLSFNIHLYFYLQCLSNGQQINYGCPYDLLQDKQSILYDFVHKLGKDEEERLFQIAKNHHNNDSNESIFNIENESKNIYLIEDKNEEMNSY